MKTFLSLTVASLIFVSVYGQGKAKKDKVLANKIFAVELTDQSAKKATPPEPDEITFRTNKVGSRVLLMKSGFPPSEYTVSVDSSAGEVVITFEAVSKNTLDEELKWEGTITGEEIEGTAQLIKKGKVKNYYYYLGTLKNKKKKK
ncbi:MAG: hypothetical protein V1781_03030 [Bacteroidota bacterium]